VTAAIVRLPPRRMAAVFICKERAGDGWLVLHGEHGWLLGEHGWLLGDRRAALQDAHWLASNLGGLPLREMTA
jgi:hypothetical protein